ncbi:hypothetical protein HMI54_011928, partial [Coelomomyces lativittatus]
QGRHLKGEKFTEKENSSLKNIQPYPLDNNDPSSFAHSHAHPCITYIEQKLVAFVLGEVFKALPSPSQYSSLLSSLPSTPMSELPNVLTLMAFGTFINELGTSSE